MTSAASTLRNGLTQNGTPASNGEDCNRDRSPISGEKALSTRELARDLIEQAFPGWRSHHELAQTAAPFMGCSVNTAARILSCETDVKLKWMLPIFTIVGTRRALRCLEA